MSSVTLRVYDLSRGLARQVSQAFLGKQIDGIWHTGVLVFGREYFYGGGLQVLAPELVVARYGMEPVQQIPLGETARSQQELEAFLRTIGHRFTAATYDLLRNNCNNFSNEVSTFLLGRGIPQHILDLPNEALSTPMGAMLRPMLENMQGGSQAFGNPFNDPTLSNSPVAAFADTPTPARAAATLSRKFAVSGSPTLHLDKIVRRIERLNQQDKKLSDADVITLHALASEMANHQVDLKKVSNANDAKILAWWKILHVLLEAGPTSQFFFPALGVFRVLLLVPSASSAVVELKNHCFDHLLRVTEMENVTLTNAQTVLLLSVLVNGFANPAATELVQARALQFLPFVFRMITESDASKKDVRIMSGKLISNCCLAMKMEEEMVITTIICGCAEVMDRLAREAATAQNVQHTLEGVVIGVGLLLQNFQAARSLSVELGLSDVLRRLHSAPSLRAMQPLLSEVVALI